MAHYKKSLATTGLTDDFSAEYLNNILLSNFWVLHHISHAYITSLISCSSKLLNVDVLNSTDL